MYRLKEIQTALLNVVGWEQSFDPAKRIDENLTDSQSGLYFQGAHPLLTLNNVASIIPEEFIFQYPEWNMIIQYKKGSKVRYNNVVYIALVDNTNAEPVQNPDFNVDFNEDFSNETWRVYNMMSDYLERQTENGIATVLQKFVADKKLNHETRSLLERKTFFEGSGRLAATIRNKEKLCGFEIEHTRSMGVTIKIEKIGLQFTGGTSIVKMYVFNSSMSEPYKTIDLNYDLENGGFKWFNVEDLYLPYISDGINARSTWFICYDQNQLPLGMEAITMNKDWSKEPCVSCGMNSIHVWRELMKYMDISPFMVNAPQDFESNAKLWDISKNIYTSTVNYGINVEASVSCDLTDFIISQRHLFANVIQKQVAANLLRTIALNPEVRVNRNQVNVSRTDVLYELDGNTSGLRPGGLGYELKKEYEALSLDTKGLDLLCLACKSKGVRFKSI